MVVVGQTQERLHVLHTRQVWPRRHRIHLGGIDADTIRPDQVAQKLYLTESKLALTPLSKQLVLTETFKHGAQMSDVLLERTRVDQNIV